MESVFQYIVKINSESFWYYVTVIFSIIILNFLTGGTFTEAGIDSKLLLQFLIVSLALKVYPEAESLLSIIHKAPELINYEARKTSQKVFLNLNKKSLATIAMLSIFAWYLSNHTIVKSIALTVAQSGLGNLLAYGLLAILFILIFKDSFSKGEDS